MKKDEKTDETVENMPEYNLKIIQNNKYFKFGVDSIALAKFAALDKTDSVVVDMCSGTGVVGLVYSRLVEEKVNNNKGFKKIQKLFFIEKQKYFADINLRNLIINNLEIQEKYAIINSDIKNKAILDQIEPNSVNIILVNPPYNISTNAVISAIDRKSLAKFEEKDFLDAFFSLSSILLKNKAKIFMVHRPERIVDIFSSSRKYNIEPKVMRYILSDPYKKPALVLLKFVKNGNNFLKIENPFIIGRD